ncbi:MAG TPA: abscisic acid-deficient protein Aba4 family protein [Allosphingosinicella sp.]|nr:abscisic acid-deficient protein Aba4 family protein [Allosphingosinicella sp.]
MAEDQAEHRLTAELRLVGWVHYLAFDLWVGSWEVEEAGRTGMGRAALIPSLVLTWLVGPIGLLTFLALRRVSSAAFAGEGDRA